jgi:hypothetical protein
MVYSVQPAPFDPVRAAQSTAEIARGVRVIGGDPAQLHLTEQRGIPVDVVLDCADLRLLTPPIVGRPGTDFACVSYCVRRPAPS